MNKKQGFSFIELLVVVAIIGILAGLAALSVSGARAKARDALRKSDMHHIRRALHAYQSDFEEFPESEEVWGDLPSLDSNYIKDMPSDPVGTSPYRYATHDSQTALDVEFAVECALENFDDQNSGEASGDPLSVSFISDPSSTLVLTENYNYAITSF